MTRLAMVGIFGLRLEARTYGAGGVPRLIYTWKLAHFAGK